ncbi:NAD-binding protein [Peniophora sp. CONT]|nr:NAD-binding protein [Peniophora sp. CONT]
MIWNGILQVLNPPLVEKNTAPVRFGILSTAGIASTVLALPARDHPDVVVRAVASRDETRANAFAKKHSISVVYHGASAYQDILNDPDIDVVYVPLPIFMHYEWTMKALAAGKHVLLEKPSACTAEETRTMFAFAEKKGLILMEAFHYPFHPATQRAKAITESGEIGEVKEVHTGFQADFSLVTKLDFKYDIGHGAYMDIGCYALSIARHLSGANPVRIVSATADTDSSMPRVDIGTDVEMVFEREIKATTQAHFRVPRWPRAFGFLPYPPWNVYARVVGTKGELYLYNFVAAFAYHYIAVSVRGEDGKVIERTEKHYGKEGWSTYRYQLEAFVDKVRGRKPQHWYDGEDSIQDMTWIQKVYEETGLGARPASSFKLQTVDA